jgi:hypothetical protein
VIALEEEIRSWRSTRNFGHVEAIESHEVTQDNDYQVTYEITFASPLIDRLQLSLFATRDGYVGVGMERWERIAARRGLHIAATGYVTGHEPGPMSQAQLRAVLDAAAAGDICLIARPGLFGIGRSGAAVLRSSIVRPELFAGPHWKWLRVSDQSQDQDAALKYMPW